MKKRGVCLCDCGGEVLGANVQQSNFEDKMDPICKRCGTIWDRDYVFEVRPPRGIIELSNNDQYNFVRHKLRG
jgi:hypothetical protein